MIYDCFPFYNELDLLELRFRELQNVVDRHVVVQAEETHSGLDKPIYFNPEDPRWAPWADKIDTILLPKITDPIDGAWTRENATRKCLTSYLDRANSDDLVIISDVDEIPDARLIAQYAPQATPKQWVGFKTPVSYFYLNLRAGRLFPCIGLARVETVRAKGAQGIRNWKKHPPIGPIEGGWHFSYIGSPETIIGKLRAFAHTEYSDDRRVDLAYIAERIAKRENLFWPNERKLTWVPISTLPQTVQANPERYASWLLSEGA